MKTKAGPSLVRSSRDTLLEDIFLQPWYLPRKTAAAIKSLLPETHRHKMHLHFEDYGCLRCEKKNVPYGSNGFCGSCRDRVLQQMMFTIRRHSVQVPELIVPGEGTAAVLDAQRLLRNLVPRAAARKKGRQSAVVDVSYRKRFARETYFTLGTLH